VLAAHGITCSMSRRGNAPTTQRWRVHVSPARSRLGSSNLRSGAHLPSQADMPLEISGNELQLALRRLAGPAEVVVTIFSDGTPPRG